MVDEKTREELKERLMQRRRELLGQGDLEVAPNRPDPAEQADEDEQPLNEMNQVIASRRNRVRAEELAGIEATLRRMREEPEEYGRCFDCDEWIPTGRLELMPWALRCVRCQSALGGGPGDGRRRHLLDFDE